LKLITTINGLKHCFRNT